MRTTIDIPDRVYRKLESKAAIEGTAAESMLLKLLLREFDGSEPTIRTEFPLVHERESRKVNLTNAEIEEVVLG